MRDWEEPLMEKKRFMVRLVRPVFEYVDVEVEAGEECEPYTPRHLKLDASIQYWMPAYNLRYRFWPVNYELNHEQENQNV